MSRPIIILGSIATALCLAALVIALFALSIVQNITVDPTPVVIYMPATEEPDAPTPPIRTAYVSTRQPALSTPTAGLRETAFTAVPAATPVKTPIPTNTPSARFPTPTVAATPIATRTPVPTFTPTPEATVNPAVYCPEWEQLVLDWINGGNNYQVNERFTPQQNPAVPGLPNLSASQGGALCVTAFPKGRILDTESERIGADKDQLLPGTYQFSAENGDTWVSGAMNRQCYVVLNLYEGSESIVDMPYGKPFEIAFVPDHNEVKLSCRGYLHRVAG